jgi:phage terminase large subunit-like protein
LTYTYEEYIQNVKKKKIVVCKWVTLAVKRHLEDLRKSKFKKYQFYFNEKKAQHAIRFFTFLKHYEGKFVGKPFFLEPWQQFIIASIFGWLKKENHKRRFTTVYQEVARKNGKTSMLGGIGLYLLLADGEGGAQVFTAATKKTQAKEIHEKSKAFALTSPAIKSKVKIHRENIHVQETFSKYEPLASDADKLDGLNAHGALLDEYHAHKDDELYNVLRSSMGQRTQPLLYVITTAGFNKDYPCFLENEYTKRILQGVAEDDRFFGIIYTLDEGDDWKDKKNWIKANPNYHIMNEEDFQSQFNKALEMPTKQNEFKTKRLNIWTSSNIAWISDSMYEKCNTTYDESILEDVKCYGGLDLSSHLDITAWVKLFKVGEKKYLKNMYFLPEEGIDEKSVKDKVPYRQWADEGWITLTPGKTIDYDFVEHIIKDDHKKYNIVSTAYDPYNSHQLVTHLVDEGLDFVEFSQAIRKISPYAKELEKDIKEGNIIDGGDPVLRWMFQCSEVKCDLDNNIKPIKPNRQKSGKRIDGVIATIMAESLCTNDNEEEFGDIGVMFI